jgi:predicted HTH domain antitoxin
MKKDRTVASRLPEDLVRDLELVERVEQTDRATAVRKLLARALEHWKLDYYADRYGRGELSLGRAAEQAGVSLWRMMDHVHRQKVAVQYDLEDLRRDTATIRTQKGRAPRRSARRDR